MSRPFTPRVVTANALVEGDVVYLTPDGRWSRRHADAELIETPDRAAARLAAAAAQAGAVVGAFLRIVAINLYDVLNDTFDDDALKGALAADAIMGSAMGPRTPGTPSGAVVGAYLAEARPGPAGPEPVHFRERFRARGPSNYPHGKQAEGRDV